MLDLAVDLSFSFNSIECSVIYLHLILSKNKINNFLMRLQKIWRNDESLPPNAIVLKRNQLNQIDLYTSIYCNGLEVFIHIYLGVPLLTILFKEFVLKRDVAYITPLKFSLPFDYQNNIVTFLTASLIDYSVLRKMGHTLNCSLFFLSVSMNQLRTLFLLLQEDFKEIIKAKEADIDDQLKNKIKKHVILSNMLVQLGDSFGLIFIIHVSFVTVTICFYGIAAIINRRLEDMKNLMLCVIQVVNVYYCCKEGQRVTDSDLNLPAENAARVLYQLSSGSHTNDAQALNVSTAIYDSQWDELSCKNQKIILLSILRSQRATYIRSTSFTEISLKSFKTIMKTTWSFISLIVSMYEN
ncbi:uncharacterized protein LOC120627411 [Pararge aegeria]|uniref:uncharacterized protein LOC120627411 n=1 Tax=Pararge aegeria TaxID=116150 RepID=UPI0019CFE56A|nr:uncharacterized protein LOC120627411 [Pararge aegeria]